MLHIRTPALMNGYLNRETDTRKRLIDGWYDTGDVMRRDENGFVFFVGRADDIPECGGENVYPGEVQKLLGRHPDVAQACVVPVPDEIKQAPGRLRRREARCVTDRGSPAPLRPRQRPGLRLPARRLVRRRAAACGHQQDRPQDTGRPPSRPMRTTRSGFDLKAARHWSGALPLVAASRIRCKPDLRYDRAPAVVALLEKRAEFLRGRASPRGPSPRGRRSRPSWASFARNASLARFDTRAGVPPGAKKPNHSEKTRSL